MIDYLRCITTPLKLTRDFLAVFASQAALPQIVAIETKLKSGVCFRGRNLFPNNTKPPSLLATPVLITDRKSRPFSCQSPILQVSIFLITLLIQRILNLPNAAHTKTSSFLRSIFFPSVTPKVLSS